jgi:hypothetical protein
MIAIKVKATKLPTTAATGNALLSVNASERQLQTEYNYGDLEGGLASPASEIPVVVDGFKMLMLLVFVELLVVSETESGVLDLDVLEASVGSVFETEAEV